MDRISPFWAGAMDCAGPHSILVLAERAGGFDALEAGGRRLLLSLGVEPERAERWARTPARGTRGVAITLASPHYPARLAEMPSPPPVLCVEGGLDCLDAAAIAVVGTRACTSYGRAVTTHLAGALASRGVTVVSGLARGIDAAAHRAALGAGRTLAVVAHGLSHTAPQSHRRLRVEIVEAGGALVSVFADGVEPQPFLFPRRNRWVVGLSSEVVVVEAPVRSGALITARLAADVGRDVHAVPGRLGDAASEGCLMLLASGAGVLSDVDAFVARVSGAASPTRGALVRLLAPGRGVDELSRLTGRSARDLLAELAQMELRGEVVRLPGQRYAPGGRPT